MSTVSTTAKRGLGVLGLALIVVAAYLPGISGPFLFDDLSNILQDPSIALEALDSHGLSDVVGGGAGADQSRPFTRRPIPRLTFALNYYFSGQRFDSFAFKLTNIIIHVVNSLLVYWLSVLLCRRLDPNRTTRGTSVFGSRSTVVPLMAAAVWALHPIQLTSVLYVVQRMTSLAAFFVFAGLVVFLLGRIRLDEGRAGGFTLMITGLVGGVGLGGLCKENAVLTPILALALELFFFERRRLASADRNRLRVFYLATVAVPTVAGVLVFVLWPEVLLSLYRIREFTLHERLLTESRVLFFYLALLFYPNVRSFGLFHDDFVLSTGLLTPMSTLLAMAGWLGIFLLAIWGIRRRALWSFALFWFLVGHAVESTFMPLELVHEHRNYVPSFGIIFALVVYFIRLLERGKDTGRLIIPAAVVLVSVLGFSTVTRANIWSDRLTLADFSVRNHPDSYRSQMALAFARTEAQQELHLVYESYRRAASMNLASVLPLVEMARILQLIRLRDQGLPHPRPAAEVALLDDALSGDQAWVAAALERVDREIQARLARYPVVPTTVLSLLNLTVCAQSGTVVCRALSRASLDWHRVAMKNSRLKDVDRARLAYSRDQLGTLLSPPSDDDPGAESEPEFGGVVKLHESRADSQPVP